MVVVTLTHIPLASMLVVAAEAAATAVVAQVMVEAMQVPPAQAVAAVAV